MFRKIYKIFFVFLILSILASVFLFFRYYTIEKKLEIAFLDVGQGDAILIKTPYGQNILIDGGPDSKVIEKLGKEMDWWDKKIDLMILTHPHDDHVSGLVDVLKRYNVNKILYTGVTHTSPNYLEWLNLIQNKRISLSIINHPQVINFGEDCYLDILYPFVDLSGQVTNNINNSSIVAKLVYNNVSFLLTGDAETEIEQELLEANIDLSANVFKAGHHGSDTSNSQEFLEAVVPETVVIQVGAENDFGHPSRRVIKRLERLGADIFRNDLEGTIKFVSDGENVVTIQFFPKFKVI